MEYQNEAERMENQTAERHMEEETEFEEEVARSLAQSKRQSSQVINLRKIEETLAKQQNYLEAHKVQKQIQGLERNQYEKWQRIKANKLKNLMEQLRSKQKTQLSALEQKIQQGFEEQKKIRETQYDK